MPAMAVKTKNNMKRIDLNKFNEATAIAVAIEVLSMGGIVAYPTETFYALGAKADSEEALSRLFALKGRESGKAASLIVGSSGDAEKLALHVSPLARKLMDAYWPGPLTLVLNATPGLSAYITKDDTIALRVPGESFALRLARAAGFPITATSANPAGAPPAETADAVQEYLGQSINLLIDGGRTPGVEPSTIVDATVDANVNTLRVLRQGALRIPEEAGG